jgi:hypothetical protein
MAMPSSSNTSDCAWAVRGCSGFITYIARSFFNGDKSEHEFAVVSNLHLVLRGRESAR